MCAKQVYFGRFRAFIGRRMCAFREAPVTYFTAATPADCTQQGCEHLLSNTNKGWVGRKEGGELLVTFNMLRIQARPRLCGRA